MLPGSRQFHSDFISGWVDLRRVVLKHRLILQLRSFIEAKNVTVTIKTEFACLDFLVSVLEYFFFFGFTVWV